MANSQSGDDLNQEIHQEVLNDFTVGGNLTLGNITQQNTTKITQIFLNGLPHQRELLMNLISHDAEEGIVPARVPYAPEIHEVLSQISTASRNAGIIRPLTSIPNILTFEFEVVQVDAQGRVIKRCCQQEQYFIESLDNAVELAMVCIPNGKFLMGAPEEEYETVEDERPQHPVTVKPFSMSKYPITQAQWKAIATLPKIQRDLNPAPSYFQGDNRPVERVSWYDAVEFCQRLSEKMGREYRLPSEAEWEYACRARTTTPFHFGQTITTNLANYCGQNRKINGDLCKGTYRNEPNGGYLKQTIEVGHFPANAFGLYDMHGNVLEWCADYHHENYQGAPLDGSTWVTNGNPESRILRGGSWDDSPGFCRSVFRFFENPNIIDKEFGFRVVCESFE